MTLRLRGLGTPRRERGLISAAREARYTSGPSRRARVGVAPDDPGQREMASEREYRTVGTA